MRGTPAISRIIVALDAGAPLPGYIESAAELAQRLEADLLGLFVEDTNLLRSAALPWVRQIDSLTGTVSDFGTGDTEQILRSRARRTENALAKAAELQHITWSFRIVRGQINETICAECGKTDLLILDDDRPNMAETSAAGSVQRPVLMWRRGLRLDRPVAVVSDSAPNHADTLLVASGMARSTTGELLIIQTTGDEAPSAPDQLSVTTRTARGANLAAVATALHGSGAGVLVISAQSPLLRKIPPQQVGRLAGCPVILVR